MKPLLAILLLSCAASGGAQAPSALAQFGWFAEVAGACWTGRFPDGKTVHTQCYTTQHDRFLRGSAALSVDKDGRLEASYLGDELAFPVPSRKDPSQVAYRKAPLAPIGRAAKGRGEPAS